VLVLYRVFANPAFGCHIPINDGDDDLKRQVKNLLQTNLPTTC